ncbi:MAG: hypothetical protein QM638_07975 [Nocardioides sp.]|uniref:hypothetical protein n=1 Tax=Nocardioides sp. TaxID=35761 RepID=UPI0039E30542
MTSLVVLAGGLTAPAGAATWASASSATIHPGVMMYTDGAQCTANFVYTDSAGNVYVGYAAHCAGLGESTDTNGCSTESLPLGTKVTFNSGGSLVDEGTVVGHGTLVYSSWLRMQKLGTSNANVCAYNDLALVKVAAAEKKLVNPSVPFWGGPTGIDTDGTAAGDRVWTYGNSSLRAGISALSPHTGISLGDDSADGGWSHPLYTVTPGIPGDSGSGFLSADGKAIGVLSTLGLAPLPASNNIGDLSKELGWAQKHSGIAGLRLVKGTEPFDPGV